MRAALLITGLVATLGVVSCEVTAPKPLDLCGSWLIQRGDRWDTLSASITTDDLTPTVTLAKPSGTEVITVTSDELIAMSGTPALGCSPASQVNASRTLRGTVAGIPSGRIFTLAAAGSTYTATSAGFDLQVPEGGSDLFAYVAPPPPNPAITFILPEKMIVRRGVSLPDGTQMPVFGFASSEAFTLQSASLTSDVRNGVIGETTQFFSGMTGLDMRRSNTLSTSLIGLPEAQLKEGDYHLLTVTAIGSVSTRLYYRKIRPTMIVIPAAAASGIASVAETTPCTKTRVTVPVQTDYPSFIVVTVSWSAGTGASGRLAMSLSKDAAAGNGFWSVEVPDLGSTCLIPGGATYTVSALVGKGRLAVFRGVTGTDGEALATASSAIVRP